MTMNTLFNQKCEKLKALILDPYELKKEIKVRANAFRVLKNYKTGVDLAPFPSVVLLVLNETCNQRCLVCDIGRRDGKSFYYTAHFKDHGNMSRDTFQEVVKSVKDFDSELWFLATEPLLYPDLFWAIEYAASHRVRTQLTTNGYLLPEFAEGLVKAEIERICLSIDGYCAEQHDMIRGSKGSYDRVIKGLELVISAKNSLRLKKPRIFVNTVINQWNYDSLVRIVEGLVGYDIDGITLSHLQFLTEDMAQKHTDAHAEFPITGRNISCSDSMKMDVRCLHEQLCLIRRKYNKFRINVTPTLNTMEDLERYYFRPDKYIDGYSTCYMPWRYPHILANGDVIINYECFGGVLGNVKEDRLYDIWNGGKFRKLRKFIMDNNGSTPACWRCPMIYCGYKL